MGQGRVFRGVPMLAYAPPVNRSPSRLLGLAHSGRVSML